MSNEQQLIAAELGLTDEWPHEAGPDSAWQESVFFTMQDIEAGVAATFRIGHEVNNGIGHCCFSISTSQGIGYQRSKRDIKISGDDRFASGFSIDNFATATFEDGSCRWVARDADSSVDLTFTDCHPRYNVFGLMASAKARAKTEMEESFASNSIAMSGRVTGSVRIGDKQWQINGTGSRDHSWGNRHVRSIKNWVWLTGGFDSNLCFAAGAALTSSNQYAMQGFVLQQGKLGCVIGGDVVVGLEMDGITARESKILLVTDALGEFSFDAKGFAPNMLLDLGDTYNESFMPCELTWEDKTTTASIGFAFNPREGSSPVGYYRNAVHENGITNIPILSEGSLR